MKTSTANSLLSFLNNISKKCNGKLGFAVARNIRILSTELTEYHNQRNELIKKYGTEKGDQIIIENGSKEHADFIKEMKEYEDIELEINLMKVDEETLSNSDLSADIMVILINYMVD